jgi:hypothetical protein
MVVRVPEHLNAVEEEVMAVQDVSWVVPRHGEEMLRDHDEAFSSWKVPEM